MPFYFGDILLTLTVEPEGFGSFPALPPRTPPPFVFGGRKTLSCFCESRECHVCSEGTRVPYVEHAQPLASWDFVSQNFKVCSKILSCRFELDHESLPFCQPGRGKSLSELGLKSGHLGEVVF